MTGGPKGYISGTPRPSRYMTTHPRSQRSIHTLEAPRRGESIIANFMITPSDFCAELGLRIPQVPRGLQGGDTKILKERHNQSQTTSLLGLVVFTGLLGVVY